MLRHWKSVFKSFISSLHDLKVYNAHAFNYKEDFLTKLEFIQSIDKMPFF
ncbi:hypothetical protein Echvi_2801 [Echinicola vietnamensis DSM 17526]|uniref:Uncharacterized protein n=1 Tax=Echinicola vietnamensis (strain DSM 17526 / LMG 23754 / KMM 6221) TaxID=926556 RepID=L0G2I5_ECHVK|nr:hypothetical protein Echvi_2801 [Echinicola vietnamensis DSM 17526]